MKKTLFATIAGGLCLCAALVTVNDTRTTAPPHTGRSGAMEALEFWSGARAYPHGDLSPDAHFRAFEKMREMPGDETTALLSTSGWNYIGPSNLSGRMLSIAVNPFNTGTIYAGSASGGLWRSHTGGLAGDWHRVATGYPVLGVGAIAIDPADSGTIYIGTGEVYRYGGTAGGLVIRTTRGSYGMGILKTTNAGATWTKSLDWSYHQQRGVQMIRVNPLNSASVWAATSEGIYRSTDAGATWAVSLPIPMAQDIIIHPADTLNMLASTGNLGLTPDIYKTVDGGEIWFPVTPTSFTGKTLMAQYASNPDVVYASIADSTTGVGSLWRTDNFGFSWTKLSDHTTNNIYGVQGWYSHFVAVHPGDSTQVLHAGVPASRSADGGYFFSGVGGSYSDHHGYAYDPVDPDILYIANDDGIYRSTNFGQNFTKVSTNLGTGQFYAGFSNSATDSLIALGQVQDHIPGYLYQGSSYWPASAADEVGWTGIDQLNDFIMYAGTRGGGSIRKSTNRGVSWAAAGGSFSGRACWNTPFVVSPSHPNVLYFGRSRVSKSTNSAGSWFYTNGGLELADGNPPLSMAISATSPDSVYLGTAPLVSRTHIYRTTNGGTTWTDVTGPLPDRYPLDIAVDPITPAIVYVGYGGYGTGHVFKSTDAGGTWTDLTGSLPDIPVTALLVDPLSSDVVYLGTDLGVSISTDGGASWLPFGDGLPEAVLVSDLTMTPSNRTLRASTHGNGVFERKMPALFPSLEIVSPNGGEEWETGQTAMIRWSQTLLSQVTIRYSTDDGSTWADVASSIPAYPDSFAWTVPPTLSTQARVRVLSATDTTLAVQSAAPFTISYDGVIFDIAADWNLLSVPVAVPDYSAATLFPAAITKAYGYSGSYVPRDTLRNGAGYWLKFPGPALYPLAGDSLATDTIPLTRGWNLIGSLTGDLPASALTTDPPGLLTTPLYGFSGAYDIADTVEPGRGYWVKASGAGNLFMQQGPILKSGARLSPEQAGTMSSLTITDAAGHQATLLLAPGDRDDLGAFDLPPVPPEGAFDVRFTGDRSAVAVVSGSLHAIRHRGVLAPVEIRWAIRSGESYILRTGDGGTIRLTGTGSTGAGTPEGLAVGRDVTGTGMFPGSPVLFQNYPNPFNPATRIRFSLPAAADRPEDGIRIVLRVFDPAGRQVATLVDGELPAGEHTVEWDATGLPSGVYVYSLSASGRTGSMKMLLLK